MHSYLGATFKRHAAATIPLFRRAKIMTNLDLIIDYTDKLMNNYRREPLHKVHTDILDQSRNLLLALFGYIGFDYDLETLNGDGRQSENELTQALQYMVNTFEMVFYFPGFMSTVILNLSPKYRQARRTIEKYLKQMIDKEISESAESRAERKRTCLIASLVASRQLNEQEEANKAEDEKKGNRVRCKSNHRSSTFVCKHRPLAERNHRRDPPVSGRWLRYNVDSSGVVHSLDEQASGRSAEDQSRTDQRWAQSNLDRRSARFADLLGLCREGGPSLLPTDQRYSTHVDHGRSSARERLSIAER